jgi:mycothiol maleylpyruvate isomerase-like protein
VREMRQVNDAAKQRALAELDREWRELDAIFRRLTPAELERPMYTEDGSGWRIRDLIPHIATWQGRAALAARKVATDGVALQPDERVRTFIGLTDSVDDMNDVTFREWRQRSVADLLAEFRAKHDELIGGLAALAPEQIMTGEGVDDLFTAFRVPGLVHLRKHRAELESALAKEGAAS